MQCYLNTKYLLDQNGMDANIRGPEESGFEFVDLGTWTIWFIFIVENEITKESTFQMDMI
jgi:hypothetical protein